MQDFSSILAHIAPFVNFKQEERELFISVLRIKQVKRKEFVEQPGYVSRYRSFVVKGALRAYIIGTGGEEHTIALAVEDRWIGDAASFFLREPATLFVQALEDSTLIQWNYESEQMLLRKIPAFAVVMMERSQQIAIAIQRRVIAQLSLSAEERYDQFARENPIMLQRIPIYIIASYLGMTREFLSKIRRRK